MLNFYVLRCTEIMGKEILEHDPYVDYVKAIGIVFVVFSHVDNRADSFLFLFYGNVFCCFRVLL